MCAHRSPCTAHVWQFVKFIQHGFNMSLPCGLSGLEEKQTKTNSRWLFPLATSRLGQIWDGWSTPKTEERQLANDRIICG